MAAYYVKSGVASIWVALTAYTTERVAPTLAYGTGAAKGRVYEATTAGTSGATQPTWNTTVGGTTADGTVVWTTRDITSWTNASPYLHYALKYASVAGDTIYVSSNHAETVTQTDDFTSPGTTTLPVKILSADDSATPPTTLLAGATVTLNTNNNCIFTGHTYSFGVSYTIGSGLGSGLYIYLCYYLPGWWKFDSCTLNVASTGSGGIILGDLGAFGATSTIPQLVEFQNTKIQFGSTGSYIYPNASFSWRDTPTAISGTPPTTLLNFQSGAKGCVTVLSGVDISALTGNIIRSGGNGINSLCYLQNCKLNAGVTPSATASQGRGDTELYMHNCDSGATTYKLYEFKYAGNSQTETTLVRTGGASDGTTTISWKMVSGANNFFYFGLDSPWISQWQNTTGSAKTATIEILHDSVTALTDAEVYAEVEYFASTNPSTSFANDRAADILATPVAQTTSSETWTTTGMANPNKQKLEVSFTPGMVGLVRVKVYLLKPSYTIYVDPLVTIA